MSAEAVRYYLMQDVVDGVAATVSANNAGFWPLASDVPDYAFKSLGTIWFGSVTPSSTLGNQIVYRLGLADTATNEITLYTLPMESVVFDSIRDNTIGAEESNLIIRLIKPQKSSTTNFETIQNTELRIRYLLDMNWRRLRKGVYPNITSTGDNSLDPTFGVKCMWDGYLTPPNAVECQVRYKIYYRRAVPRVP